jgi:hypothetical protein
MRVHTVPSGTCHASRDGLAPMTDREWADRVDVSPPIRDAYANLGRIAAPTLRACEYASVFGIKSRISGATRGDSPAVAQRRVR